MASEGVNEMRNSPVVTVVDYLVYQADISSSLSHWQPTVK